MEGGCFDVETGKEQKAKSVNVRRGGAGTWEVDCEEQVLARNKRNDTEKPRGKGRWKSRWEERLSMAWT